jgi:hypothetical protein
LCSEAQVDILSQTDDGGADEVKSGMLLTGCVEIGAAMMKGIPKKRKKRREILHKERRELTRIARWTEVVEALMKASCAPKKKIRESSEVLTGL